MTLFRKALLLGLLCAIWAAIMAAPAHADMCGPAPGPLAHLYPMIKSCQPFYGGAPGPSVPSQDDLQTVPYPIHLPWLP
jgi:hypothetical protein